MEEASLLAGEEFDALVFNALHGPAYHDSITRLARSGVPIMDPDDVTTRADDGLATFEWSKIHAAIKDLRPRETSTASRT
ncbi:hypothetical protein HFP15_03630 [Amycolatopsis sp. K13G38]|uniref:Uncharacterized protein n=1 Tax=Amycolatopsis acididurans TaxID=2724524 RepID=A0ABX1IZ27_9PSEU|nr:hypothetical protein [Amycolatopsis acididurans]NKQ51969.1 hypothetical protein [Amycolatopsis acididurans]